MSTECKITVFTPTYNRAYILENLYRSLQRQRFRDFEWLVVDDGSDDNTRQLLETWQAESNPFPIRYIHQENGGKCRAINQGLKHASGLLFYTVDSDDYLTDDALEKIAQWEQILPREEKFCGFCGNLGTAPDTTPNSLFPEGYFDGNAFDRYGAVTGERAFVFYTDIHRRYLYPEFPGEKFMTEAVTWNRMAHDGYKLRFYNDVICIYEYKPDGLTQAGYELFLKNPQGTGLFFREKAVFLKYPLKTWLGMWYGFTCDAMDRCTNRQIAQYIAMPLWLVQPMKWVHGLLQLIRKKR